MERTPQYIRDMKRQILKVEKRIESKTNRQISLESQAVEMNLKAHKIEMEIRDLMGELDALNRYLD